MKTTTFKFNTLKAGMVFMVMLLTGILSSLSAASTDITVRVLDESSNPLSGASAAVYYKASTYPYYSYAGTTSNGTKTLTGLSSGTTYNIYVSYNFGNATVVNAVSGTNTNADFATTKVSVNINNCNGLVSTNSAYVRIKGNSDGYFHDMGYTSGGTKSMYLIQGISYDVQMDYNFGRVTQTATTSGTTQSVDFNSTCVKVNLKDCNGNVVNANGAYVRIKGNTDGYFHDFGYTSAGTLNVNLLDLPTGGYDFQMDYNFGRVTQTAVAVGTSSPFNVDFTATCVKVSLKDCNGGTVNTNGAYVRIKGNTDGYFHDFGYTAAGEKNIYLLDLASPASYDVQMDYNFGRVTQTGIAVGTGSKAIDFNATCVKVSLKDCNGSTVNTTGAYVRIKGNTDGYFHDFGYTAAGELNTYLLDLSSPSSYDVQMDYNFGRVTQTGIAVGTGSKAIDFTATCVKISLKNCGTTINTNGAYVRIKGNTDGYFHDFGYTSAGEKNIFLLDLASPSSYDVQMDYNNTRSTQTGISVGTGSKSIDISATKVQIAATGSISYKGNIDGYARTYTNPMYFLEGCSMTFTVGGIDASLVTSGCTMSKTAVIVKLISSTNAPISGGAVQYYSGGWQNGGTTGASGAVLLLFNGTPGSMSFAMTHAYGRQEMSQNVGSNPVVVFQTKAVKIELRNSSGNLAGLGEGLQYYAGGWRTFGSGNTTNSVETMELLPISYSFALSYKYARQEKSQNTASSATVTFSTVKVSMELRDHNNVLLGEGSGLQYYAGGWRTFGSGATTSGVETMEMLPLSYSFALSYGFARQEKSQNTGSNTTVTFSTNLVTMELRDHNGALLGEGDGLQYYAGGWRTFGSGITTTGIETMEMLPLSYSFALSYGFARQEKSQNTGSNSTVTFSTNLVTMELRDHNGALLGEGDGLQYYAGGWRTFGSGATTGGVETMEMLPLSYSFALSRGYARQEKSQNTGTSSTVTFSTTLVTMELRDHSGALLGEGDGLQYYAGGWRTFGSGNTTGGYETMEMLPLSYSFALSYGYARQEKSQNVSSNSTVTYNTTLVTVRLDDGASGLNGGAAKYYAGGWRTFGTTGSSATGECQKEMLPLSYSFSMDYSAKHKEKSDAISGTTDNVNFVYSGGSLNRVVTKTTGKEGSKLVAGQDATTDNSNQIGKAESNSVPVVTGLTCYPNPTVSSATVAYQLSSTQQVSVDVYAANGVRVMTLSNGIQDAGNHSASLSADQLKGGIYYVRVITASGISQVPVMVNK